MNRFIFFILMSLLLIVYTIFDITQLYLFKNSLKETAIIVNSGSIDRIETGTTLQLV